MPAGDVYRRPLLKGGVIRTFTVAILIIFCPIAPCLFAQEEEPASEIQETDLVFREAEREIVLGESPVIPQADPVSVWSILRVLLTLAVVAAAIYGLVYLIKRAGKGNTAKDPYLKVLASTSIGINRGVHVVSVGTQAWLVGAAENGVHLIAEIGDKDILNAMLLDESQKTAGNPQGNFLDFKSLLGRLGVKTDAAAPGPENIRKRSERLKGL